MTERLRRHWRTLRWPLWVSALVLLLAVVGDNARFGLRYERDSILMQHQYWRLLSGHLVHGSWRHAGLNLVGLWLIASLFRGCYTFRQWLLIVVFAVIAMDAGFIWLMPELQWYVGLSGLLHGLLAAGALAWWRMETKPMALALTLVLIGKLIWEQWQGALPLVGELNVIVNAHLYGACGGALAGICVLAWQRAFARL